MNTKNRKKLAMRAVVAAVSLALSAHTLANPVGPTVVAGQASFATQSNSLTVTNTPGAIINWQGFSIGQNELTRFTQQSAVSSVLNRVTGGNPSDILGRLYSNGRVFLINPSGITFGIGSQIDVAGLVASSLNLSDSDFISGRCRFSGNGNEGRVVNNGAIASQVGGRVVLVGPQVENSGVIRAPNGAIVLAAGSTVQMLDAAFPSIQIEVSAPADRPLKLGELSPSGNVFAYVVKQSGTLIAATATEGGRITLHSAGSVQLAPTSIVEAGGTTGGQIDIAGIESVLVGGLLSANATGGPGGTVRVASDAIDIVAGAKIEASGATGGGKVFANGALQVSMSPDTLINANALDSGNGGHVELIAEQVALFAGTIEARGGPRGGDGGAVEVSGKKSLVFSGSVDTRAPMGNDGNLTIDPTKISIVATSAGLPVALGDAMWAATEDPGTQSLSASSLATLLATTSVTLQAAEKIELNPGVTVNVSAAATRTLTLAAPNILIQGTFRSTGAPLNVALNAGGGTVRIAQDAGFALAGGALSVTAQSASSSLTETTPRETQTTLTRAVNSDLAALRAQVDAEIARDNTRVSQALKSCGKLADTRQGCAVGTPTMRRFTFAGA